MSEATGVGRSKRIRKARRNGARRDRVERIQPAELPSAEELEAILRQIFGVPKPKEEKKEAS